MRSASEGGAEFGSERKKGRRLERTVPGSERASWGRQARRVRRIERGMLDGSRLSMWMAPLRRLRRRRMARMVDDFPLRNVQG